MNTHGNKIVFGIVNCAFFNRNPQGDETWYATRELRNAAIAKMRESAIARGLSASAAQAGIYPVKKRLSLVDQAVYTNTDQTAWLSRPGTW